MREDDGGESPEYRSWVMSRVRSKHTTPELRVRSLVHRAGYRFRLHDGKLPGRPDLVLRKYRTVIFVNGCFWHRHPGCKRATTPKTNIDYWQAKFDRKRGQGQGKPRRPETRWLEGVDYLGMPNPKPPSAFKPPNPPPSTPSRLTTSPPFHHLNAPSIQPHPTPPSSPHSVYSPQPQTRRPQ